jgi:SRSO17 transposase
VGRQYTGSAGKVTNCQIGVFAAYVSTRGHAFVDRALYLPKSWAADPARLAAAHVPKGTAFATKPALAVEMIKRAIRADMPFAWVAADAVYGVGDIEQALRLAGKSYVLGVKGDHRFGSWGGKPEVAGTAAQIASDLDPATWQRLSSGQGTNGECFHDWAYIELADLEADEYAEGATGTWTRCLSIRRHVADGDLTFFTTCCPVGTTIETLVGVEGHR